MPSRPRPLTHNFSELENPNNPTPVEEYVSSMVQRRIPDRRKARPPGKPPCRRTCEEQLDALRTALRLYRRGDVTAAELAQNWGVPESRVVEWIEQKRQEGEL